MQIYTEGHVSNCPTIGLGVKLMIETRFSLQILAKHFGTLIEPPLPTKWQLWL